ncbi:hypothetical protein [Aurantiacibacter luteus]|uniref:Uncharacterized protein n=1 Tax=Aurantiacibacter luteus TaxID=1581420 RepID=A0A0G9MWE6_9SPHN|nr:hypothetical protein [Aurantiacibacter luteus]KLE35097.1 hypothetical protein AAW00_00995 [Aurantiacibacter luteus]
MARRPQKLFDENMPGNYMPANRDGCIVMLGFVAMALIVVFAGQMLGNATGSPWPGRAGWVLFVCMIVALVRFAKRHS